MSAVERLTGLERQQRVNEYNYDRFRSIYFIADLQRASRGDGILPGQEAPDFELVSTESDCVRLSAFRGRPVVLRFVNITCPLTAGSNPPLKEVHAMYGDQVQFLDVFVRQAHPGECRGAYRSFAQKAQSAQEYKREEGIPWPVLVDDHEGTVHLSYGGMSNPCYLIDAEGRVAFYGMWTNAVVLRRSIEQLLSEGAAGEPMEGAMDRTPHLFASFVNGWHGLKRGCLRAVIDYELSVPGAASLTFLGSALRPVLAPLALRTTPIPSRAKWGIFGSLLAIAGVAAWLARRR